MNYEKLNQEFSQLNGQINNGFPVIDSLTFQSPGGVPYLKRPGVAMISKPSVNISGVRPYLEGFDPKLDFLQYLDDPTSLPDGDQLTKLAGQTCYASFGPKRTMNEGAEGYFRNLIESGHGSVLEHPNFSFLVWGISRSVSHEWVRHRAGMAYSQLSQRYVSGRVLRFVERPEYQNDEELHGDFIEDIERAASRYEERAQKLLKRQKAGGGILSAEQKTDQRKKVQQAARSLLPNETETVMVVTGNDRAWRHVSYMRASQHAEIEIRQAAYEVFLCLAMAAPAIFSDFEIVDLPDGTKAVTTQFPKV